MSTLQQTDTQITFTERISQGMRVFLFVIGLLPWLAPYELLIKPRWDGFGIALLFAIAVSLGAIAVSLAFIGGAVFGLDQTLTFDINAKSVLLRRQSVVTALSTKRYAFRDIERIETHTREWESRSNTYGLKITFSDGSKTTVGDFSEKAEAEEMKDRLHRLTSDKNPA